MVHLLLLIIYLAFISLGLPDSLLGSAWPSMYTELKVPISYAGIISMIIAIGTVLSSLQSDRLTKKLGTGKLTALSVAMTAIALFGFSISHSFISLCFWAIPYGLGAGSVDAALNNYVAINFKSHHMSWLHCMWGVGTIVGPYIMGYALTNGLNWNFGYKSISFIQIALTLILIFSLPLWKKRKSEAVTKNYNQEKTTKVLSIKEILKIPGVIKVMITFFCYCALEQTTMIWASSYMVLHNNISTVDAARYASMFFIGITIGRAINGFLTFKFTDTQMIRCGQFLICSGIIVLLLSLDNIVTLLGLILIGLGCAPVYPCIIHSIPSLFGEENSQAIIGIQMASAYVGTCLMPPLFGVIANSINIALLPLYLLIILIVMVIMHETLIKQFSLKNKA